VNDDSSLCRDDPGEHGSHKSNLYLAYLLTIFFSLHLDLAKEVILIRFRSSIKNRNE
jgi:hypothetical protein